jgi:sensor histidine kinase regulating citrate/malate metabolism
MGIFSWVFDKRAAEWQNDLITRHCAEVGNIYRQMRGWRHDYHNHIQAMKGLALGVSEELDAYLNKLDEDLTRVDTLIKTGNVMADAILNSKLSLAQSRKIAVNAKAFVPNTLSVSDIDFCVIVGNLLDNAIEACGYEPDESNRFIRVYIDVMREQLYLSVSNSTFGKVKRSGQSYRTSKSGAHGFGLARVDKIVEKYGGYVNRQNEEGIFATEIMLPL